MHDVAERMLDRLSVAEMLGCSPASVDRYERQGVIPKRRRLSRGRVGWLYSEMAEALRALPTGKLTERTRAASASRANAD